MWKKTTLNNLECWSPAAASKRIIYQADNMQQFLRYINKGDTELSKTYGSVNPDCYLYYVEEEITNDLVELPAGFYRVAELNYDLYLTKTELSNVETVLDLGLNKDIIQDFNSFLSAKSVYEDLKLKYKRGVLLYGPPGTGKTSTIHKILTEITDKNTIVIFIDQNMPRSMLKELQKSPSMKIIIFEEFTNVLNNQDEASDSLLDFLDGESSLTDCFVIATTNYPERLPKNITDRPGRFDRFYKLDTLKPQDITKYLANFKLTVTEEELDKLVGKTIAEVKEIILMYRRDNIPFLLAIEAINKQKDLVSINFEDQKKRIGYIL